MERKLTVPFDKKTAQTLRAGDYVYLSGRVYTARDAAHKRMIEALDNGEKLPFDINGSIIYYMGPSPAREGRPIGSAGPTTASRMDRFTPRLLDLGLGGMIGKGRRTDEVRNSMVKNNAVYFAAIGGAGALLSKCIKTAKIVAYEDLGPEAVRELTIENLPAIVVMDSLGTCLYDTAPEKYRTI